MIYLAGSLYLVEIVIGLIAWGAAWEAARRLRRIGPFQGDALAPQVIIAATGQLPGLEDLRDALAGQSVPIGALTFAVEAAIDPAHARIASVFRAFDPPVTTVIAGLAMMGGQKSRNLAAALRQHDDTRPLVLADVDIVPQRDWLATLLRPIQRHKADIVTGYRWPIPLDTRAPTLLISWIDRSIAALPKPVGSRLIWGGSVAVAAGACTRMGLPDRLEPEISDDLFLAELARQHGLRVAFATAALLATPTGHGWGTAYQFGRRQYQMIRMYAPPAYAAALIVTTINLLGTAAPLAFIGVTGWAAMAYGLLVGLSILTAHERTRLSVASGIPRRDTPAERRLRLLPLALPVVHLVHLILIIGAVRVRTVRWGRCTYRMAGRKVVSVERER